MQRTCQENLGKPGHQFLFVLYQGKNRVGDAKKPRNSCLLRDPDLTTVSGGWQTHVGICFDDVVVRLRIVSNAVNLAKWQFDSCLKGRFHKLLERTCAMNENTDEIRQSIKERYATLARSPGMEQDFPVGPDSAKSLGYSVNEIDKLPDSATESFAGVGNPFSLGEIGLGQTVLDLGCGAGMDSILAARQVGPSGKVIGIDMSSDMVDKARQNAEVLGLRNIDFQIGEIEALDLSDGTADVAISNGVFNLCLDKPKVVAEIFRVLAPGGKLFMADMILKDHVTPQKVQLMGSWSG